MVAQFFERNVQDQTSEDTVEIEKESEAQIQGMSYCSGHSNLVANTGCTKANLDTSIRSNE